MSQVSYLLYPGATHSSRSSQLGTAPFVNLLRLLGTLVPLELADPKGLQMISFEQCTMKKEVALLPARNSTPTNPNPQGVSSLRVIH